MSDLEMQLMKYDWLTWARPEQLPPDGDWITWLILSGRGFGKTRAGAEFIRSQVCGKTPLEPGACSRIALVAETAADARDVIVEGDSGLLRIHPNDFRPTYEPSKRRLTWPNGAWATLFNATEPDQLRGPEHDVAWCDELCKWKYAEETWANLTFGLRIGEHPRRVVTTTPRPIRLLRDLLQDSRTVTTRGSTYDNKSNLSDVFIVSVKQKYEGSRLGRQELGGEVLEDVPGALWSRAVIDRNRVRLEQLPDLQRIVVAIDPGTQEKVAYEDEVAETGIIVAGLGVDGRGYVLDDVTCTLSPNGWARKAIAAFDLWGADRVVAEINQGGQMVEECIRSVRPNVPFKSVRATRGKAVRAEPVAALYEQDRISHVGTFPALEDQQMLFTSYGVEGSLSPDRVDALVWAFTELFPQFLTPRAGERREIRQTNIGFVF